jgi:glycosyltransferase involved in cell wall biosynthesis
MNSSQPLVSICIPTRNSARYIRETLDSLRVQTYPHCEIIVSDNASSDGTVALLEEYAEAYGIRVLLNDTDAGAGENFNRLIASATGDYVAIYHADDLYDPDIVAESVAVLQKHRTVGLVGTLAEAVDAGGMRLFDYRLPEGCTPSSDGCFDFDAALSAVLRTRKQEIFFVTPSIMVRREVYRAVGLFDQRSWRSSVDYEMWLRIACRYPVAVINRPLMHYRIHAAQGSELEVRKNSELPDILAVIAAYQRHLHTASVDRQCTATMDRIRVKTALKQNAVGQFAKSAATIEPLGTIRYRICACVIRCANALRLNMHLWP